MEPRFSQSLVAAALENPKNLASEQELREAINLAIINFQNCDNDKSGALTFSELPSLCEGMGLPLGADEEETMANFSKSDSGYLDLEGWVTWWINRVSALPNPLKQQEAIARNTFRKFDKDGSGTLNGRELYDMLLALGADLNDAEIQEAMKELDLDGNGWLNVNEFVEWWTSRASNNRKSGGLMAMKLKKLATKASQIFYTDIFTAAWNNDVDLVRSFLDADCRLGVSVDDSAHGDGWTALHYAAYQGHVEVVTELLKSNASLINKTNNNGFTPLFYAAQQSRVELCSLLMDSGADPTCTGWAPENPHVFMCPVDHVIDTPDLRGIFEKDSRCAPPTVVPADKIAASISFETFMLTVNTQAQRYFTSLPIRSWTIKLWTDQGSDDDAISYQTAAKNPTVEQCLEIVVDKNWLKQIQRNKAKLLISVIATNSLGAMSPPSGIIDVTITTNLPSSVTKKASPRPNPTDDSPPSYSMDPAPTMATVPSSPAQENYDEEFED